MTIKLQGTWEAERVARIVEMWNPANDDLAPWRDDCVSRMRRQIDSEIKRRKEKMNCNECHYRSICNYPNQSCIVVEKENA